MFSCEEVLAELSNYIDDDVSASLRKEIEMHLLDCRTCQAIYDSTRKTLYIVTESRSFELPESISTQVTESIRAKIRGVVRTDSPTKSDS